MNTAAEYEIFALGDRALTVSFGNRISEAVNETVLNRVAQLRALAIHGIKEVVPAYSSFTVFYDPVEIRPHLAPGKTAYMYLRELVSNTLLKTPSPQLSQSRLVRIPVCYDPAVAPDLDKFLTDKELTREELIDLHTRTVYRVYMLGFLPGFAYMGEVDQRLQVPRKGQPVPTRAGSVGIAGVQTGIYPFASPGGWHIIGNSPVRLFNKHKPSPTLLQAGDRVQFFAIDKYEFAHY